jgi:glycogen debranching enzyme
LETNKAYYSGLPWFLQYWARDLFWSLPAVIDLGEFEKAKKILKMFSENASNGQIPNTIYNNKPEFLGIDTTTLWIITLAHYYRNSNDIAFLKNCKSQLNAALAFLRQRDIDNDGLLEHDEKQGETWMDSRNRKQNAVEVQALYVKAMEEAEFLFSVFGEEKKVNELKAMVFLSLDAFEKFKVFDSFLADRLIEKTPVSEQSCNALVPIMLGTCNKKTAKHILLEIESNVFDATKGTRAVSKFEKDYSPVSYHSGMVWSLTTAWASAAEFYCSRSEKGEHFLHKLIEDLQQDALGCVGECWNAETSELSGCGLQLWGSAFIVRIIDEFLLGIKANAKEKTFFVSPRLPNSISFVKRKKRLEKEWTEITIKRTEKGIVAKSSNKRIKVVLSKN